jgi:hypothetical protein
MADARINAKTKPYRAAVTAQLAIAILILIRAPVRMQNLASYAEPSSRVQFQLILEAVITFSPPRGGKMR